MSDNCDKPPPVKKLRQSKLSFSPSSTKQSTGAVQINIQ